MTDARVLAELEALLAERARRRVQLPGGYCPHEPFPKQKEFVALECFEALYGGAVGSGKSDALLMAALQYVHVPGYAALILRRTYRDLALPGAIMDRAKEWLIPQGVQWNDQDKRFTFPSRATLTFGYLDTENDRFRYMGAELQFLAFDELTQFPEQWYRFLSSRLRRLQGATVPLRIRGATNPGGLGHDWVRRHFVDPDTRGGRGFVSATLDDNPHLDREAYRHNLEQLPAHLRAQLLEGKWIRDASGLVYRFAEARNQVDALPAGRPWSYVLGIDYGVKDATAFVVLAYREHDPVVYAVESHKEVGLTPTDAAERVEALSQRYDFVKIVGDTGGLGKGFVEEARRRHSLPIDPAEKTNKLGYIGLLNGAFERGMVRVFRAQNCALIAEWLELPWADESHQKEAPGFDNHLTDAFLYGWRACSNYHEREQAARPEPGTPEYYDEIQQRLEEQAEAELERQRRDDGWAA